METDERARLEGGEESRDGEPWEVFGGQYCQRGKCGARKSGSEQGRTSVEAERSVEGRELMVELVCSRGDNPRTWLKIEPAHFTESIVVFHPQNRICPSSPCE